MKKSKFLAILLAVMITLSSFSCLSVVSSAAVINGGEFDEEGNLDEKQWEFDEDTGVLTLLADVTGSLWTQFKDDIVKVVVTGETQNIQDFAFSGYPHLSVVEFKVNLDTIGKGAFQDCDSITNIDLPMVTRIDEYAFYDCDALVEVTVDSGLTTVGKNIFKSCDSLSKVTVINGVTKIGEGMFEDCIALAEIKLPDSIEEIGRLAFENCISLEEITIPDSTKIVREYAFYGCISAKSAYIGHNVSEVGEYAFGECTALENVVVKCAMPVISEGLFYGCSSLKGLTDLPEGIKTIGKNAFKDCTSFSEITIPATVTQIGDSAFDSTIITTIDIPVGVESIGAGAFTNCNYLAAINVAAKNRFYASVDGVLYNSDITELICCPAGKAGSVFVKEGTEVIGDDAFIGCTGVDVIEIPDSVTTIATNAFNGCADGLKIKANCDSYAAEYAKLYAIDIEKTHSSVSDWVITVEPTCDNAGVKEKQCEACGNVEETEVVDALGHNYDKGVVTLEPTCEADGVVTFTCQNIGCDSKYTIDIPATGHNYDNGTVTLEPTCENEGKKVFRCHNEGCYDYYEIALPATGHNMDDGTVKTEATCETDGEKVYKCKDEACNYKTTEVIPAIGHDYDEGVVTKEPTCEVDGVKTFTCENDCGSTYKEAIPATGHSYDKGVITKYPTVKANGEITFTCENEWCTEDCANHTYVVAIPNTAFDGILATNDGAYVDEAGNIQELTWLITDEYDLYIYADDTAEEWAPYRNSIVTATITGEATTVENGSFAYMNALKEANILLNLGTIEAYAFQYCENLETVVTGSISEIQNFAFYSCKSLVNVDIYGGLEEDKVGRNIFLDCENLSNVILRNGCLEIGEAMFKGCAALEEIVLPESIVVIGDSAFDGTSLKEIRIPTDVNEIQKGVFTNCTTLTAINVDSKNDNYFSVSGVLYDVSLGSLIICPAGKTGEVTVWDGTEVIAADAFIGCKNVTKVSIPDSVTTIADNAFNGCSDALIIACNCDSAAAAYAKARGIDTEITHVASDVWKVTVEPTCLKEGSKERVCSGCEYSYEKVSIDALGHEYTSSVTTKATCEKDGVLTYKCTRTDCGDTYTEVIPATNHKYDKGVVTKEATCEENGVKTFTCTNDDCDDNYTEVIPATNHKYDKGVVTKEATCEEDGVKTFTCTNDDCDDNYTEVIHAINHKYDKGVVTKEATCEEDGVKTFTCTNAGCDDEYTEAIPAINHKYDKGVVTKEATCEEDGVKTFTCTNAGCDDEYTEAIPAINHKYDAGVITKQPTLKNNGVKLFTCQNAGCGHTYTESIPNVAFSDILAINDGAYADENDEICNITWYITKSGTLYVYADGTEAEWADYKASVKSAVIAKTVKTIAKNAFANCTALESVALAEGVEVLEKNAFKGCKALTAIELPETLNKIGDTAFDGTSIKEIYIPADVDVIEKGAFTNCKKLTAINVDDKNDNYFSVSGVLYDVSLGSLIICPAGKGGTVKVKSGTKAIANDAFIGCKNVTKVSIPDSVTTIADNAFNGCSDALIIACNCDSAAAAYAKARGIDTEITHVASDVWKVTVEPTCLKEGSKERVCSGCGYSHETKAIVALGHNYDNGSVTIKATCEKDGVLTYKCTRTDCEDTYTEAVPAIGHKMDNGTVTKKATCEENGTIVYKCVNEGCKKSVTEVIKKLGHAMDKGTVVEAASCGKEGTRVYKCTNADCSHEVKKAISALTHKYSKTVVREGTCITRGLVEYKCKNCGDSYTKKPYGEHQLYSYPVREEPTCDKDGKEGDLCALCHEYVGKVKVIPATGHTVGKWITDKKATAEAAGKKHKECEDCGKTLKTETIPQLKCSRPEVVKVSNVSKGVKIKWTAESGADYYRVYRRTKNGEWKYLDSTKKTSYTDDTAKSGTKYYYSVRAINEAGISSRSNSLSKYYLEDPSLTSVTSTKSGVTIKWSKVKGAERYIIYRRTESGSYKRIKTVDGASTVSYTNKSVTNGTKYYYKVKALYSKTTSDYSNARSVTVK